MIIFPLAITQIENDDDRAFMEDIYLTYRRLLYKIALDFVNFTDADDVINAAFESLCKKISVLRGKPSNALKRYVVKVVRNTAIDHIRASSKHNAYIDYSSEETMERIPLVSADVEDYVLHRVLIADVRDAIDRLPPREKEVMLLRFYDNLPSKEIAEQLEITDNNTRGIIKRARAHIIIDLIDRKRIDVNEIE